VDKKRRFCERGNGKTKILFLLAYCGENKDFERRQKNSMAVGSQDGWALKLSRSQNEKPLFYAELVSVLFSI